MYQTQFPTITNQLTAYLQNISHLLQYKTDLPQSCVCPLHQLWSMVLQDFLILHKVSLKLLAFFFICSGTGRAVVGHVTHTSRYVQAMAPASQATLRGIITIRSLTRVYFVLKQVFTHFLIFFKKRYFRIIFQQFLLTRMEGGCAGQ